MSIEENKAIARRAYEAFNEAFRTGNLNLLDAVIDANIVDHNPIPGQEPGLEGVKKAFSAFAAAFPNPHFTVEDMIAEGDKVASRVTLGATHQGEFQGIPPTGKQVMQTGIDILRIAGGMVVERWGEFDNLGLLQQLGAIPPPGAGGS
jgi:predicted ester cyclase